MKQLLRFAMTGITFCFLFASPVMAETAKTEDEQKMSAQDIAFVHAAKAAMSAAQVGPTKVQLLDEAVLNLPADYIFVPKKQAQDYMDAIGNKGNDNLVGLVLAKEHPFRWFITVDYIKAGYVRDKEAKDWNADDLLKTLKEGNDAANEERIKDGFSAVDIIGWVEPPKYDEKTHRLVWSMLAKDREAAKDESPTVNYNTYALGRGGYFELNLVTSQDKVAQDKTHSHNVLSNLEFNKDKHYEDFNEKTDHIAAYGIAALVAGVAAKKLGLLAVLGVFLAKGAKIAVFAGLAFFQKIRNFFAKIFKRNNDQQQ